MNLITEKMKKLFLIGAAVLLCSAIVTGQTMQQDRTRNQTRTQDPVQTQTQSGAMTQTQTQSGTMTQTQSQTGTMTQTRTRTRTQDPVQAHTGSGSQIRERNAVQSRTAVKNSGVNNARRAGTQARGNQAAKAGAKRR